MERMAQKNINTGEEYDRIYFERAKKPPHDQDIRRWKRLIKPFKGGKIIDLGCLDSRIPHLLKKRLPYSEFEYLGVDIAEKAIEAMRRQYTDESRIKFWVADIYDLRPLGVASSYFDYAVLGEVIEHMERPKEVIGEAMRILKKGGTLALSTPLNEAVEPGAVDKDRHLFSFEIRDIIEMLKPYGAVKTITLGSQMFPIYVYHFPTIIAYCRKK